MIWFPRTWLPQAYSALLVASISALLASGCKDKPQPLPQITPPPPSSSPPSSAPVAPHAALTPPSAEPVRSAAPPIVSDAGASVSPDETEIGLALPFGVASFGVIALGADDEVAVAPAKGTKIQPLLSPLKPARGVILSVVDRSPARAYWVSKGRLVRRKVSKDGLVAPLEVLANDAGDFTRVSAARADTPELDVVLYIGRHKSSEGERRARVWVEGKSTMDVTPDGAGATSVRAVPLGGGRFGLLSLDARLSMSPVHARFLELDADGVPHMGEDQVVHVAGPAESQVEMAGIQIGMGPIAILPMSKDTTTFGLLSLRIGYGESEAPGSWLLFANGVTPAPIAASYVCGKPTVAFVQPQDEKPTSNKVLTIASLDNQGHVEVPIPLAVSPTITAIGLGGSAGVPVADKHVPAPKGSVGAWIAYATDVALRARPVLCQ